MSSHVVFTLLIVLLSADLLLTGAGNRLVSLEAPPPSSESCQLLVKWYFLCTFSQNRS